VLSDARFSNDSNRGGYPTLQPGQAAVGRGTRADVRPRWTRPSTPGTAGCSSPSSPCGRGQGDAAGDPAVRPRNWSRRCWRRADSTDLVADLLAGAAVGGDSAACSEFLTRNRDFFQSRVSAGGQFSRPRPRTSRPPSAISSATSAAGGAPDGRNPTDDLIGRLGHRPAGRRGAGPRETCPSIGALLLAGGHESTANMISLGIVHLINSPELRQLLREHPERYPDVGGGVACGTTRSPTSTCSGLAAGRRPRSAVG